MTAQGYEELIVEGIQGMPPHILAEVADFVYFVRERRMEIDENQREEAYIASIHKELRMLSQASVKHLEEEFENYEQRFPRKSIRS